MAVRYLRGPAPVKTHFTQRLSLYCKLIFTNSTDRPMAREAFALDYATTLRCLPSKFAP